MATVEATQSASELRVVLGRLVRRLRAENTFPATQVAVLARLERDGPQTTSALAAAECVRPQSMAQTVAELRASGFVRRRPHPIDGRCVLIELVEPGLAALREDRQGRESWLAAAMESLTPEERKALDRAVPILQRLVQS